MLLPLEVLPYDGQGMLGPDVRDGIAALIGWSIDGICGLWSPLIVWQGCEGLQCMASNDVCSEVGMVSV